MANPDEQTEIVIGQEGGFAAAMVELMAEEKLHFRVEVPEQLVVLDPSMQSKDENYVRILQRWCLYLSLTLFIITVPGIKNC